MIHLEPRHLETVRQILSTHVPEIEVRAFGSRVAGGAKPYSDLDLVFMGSKPLSPRKRALLEEAFSESNLPIRVDLVDWADASERFREIILESWETVQQA
jgi:uncharacterized protein